MKTETNNNTEQGHDANIVLAVSGPTHQEILTAAHHTVMKYMKEKTPMLTYVDMKEVFKDAVKWLQDYQVACANGAVGTIAAREAFECYEIWRPNIPDNGCTEQCKECTARKSSEGTL